MVEVILLVVITAVIAIVAIPKVSDRMDRSTTRAAIDNIERMIRASAVYVSTPLVDANGLPLSCQFPKAVAATPADSCCDQGDECAVAPDAWDVPTWRALEFAITEPHVFIYAYDSSGTLESAQFTARAHGDLDCDGKTSTFKRSGQAVVNGKHRCGIRLAPAFSITDRLE